MQSKIQLRCISREPYLQKDIFTIEGNVDFRMLRDMLVRMDELLRISGIEEQYVEQYIKSLASSRVQSKCRVVNPAQYVHASRALRCTILRVLAGCDYREMSVRLSDGALYRWFIGIGDLMEKPGPSKSTLERYEKQVSECGVRGLVEKLVMQAGDERVERGQVLGLAQAARMDAYFLDMTCVKSDIHFPVDWVLLRDGVRTLVKGMELIRKAGLRCRMEEPKVFMREMNRLAIAMGMQARRNGAKKGRKKLLRQMKKLVCVVAAHAQRHRKLLDKQWEETELSRAQVEVILRRMDTILEQLPMVIKQAHERIIGGRLVDNAEKILSLYEPDANVVVRGKAGAAVEFGNSLRLGEIDCGLIIDWKLYQGQAPADSRAAMEGLKKAQKNYPGKIKALVMDRGGESLNNQKELKVLGVLNGVCPRDPKTLGEKMKDPEFRRWQTRRAQTEARIGIFKNCFLGRPFRSKGFEHRELLVTWGVFVHNLWVIARMEKAEDKKTRRQRGGKIRSDT